MQKKFLYFVYDLGHPQGFWFLTRCTLFFPLVIITMLLLAPLVFFSASARSFVHRFGRLIRRNSRELKRQNASERAQRLTL